MAGSRSRQASRRALRAGTTVALALAAAGCVPTLPQPNSHGLTLERWVEVDPDVPASQPRLLDATFTTDALFQPVAARILLPADYDPDGEPYPVLYLLHGGGDPDGWANWSTAGEIVDTLAGTAFHGIVVMPEGGRSGWYADWHGQTQGGLSPQWETFHIDQLVPWVDANLNTTGDRSGRAIAGLSMGGLGALMYAGRHPDVFSAVGSFSGGTDLTEPGAQLIVYLSAVWYGAEIGGPEGQAPSDYLVSGDTAHAMATIFDPPDSTGSWPDRNPVQLAAAYHAYDTRFGLYSG